MSDFLDYLNKKMSTNKTVLNLQETTKKVEEIKPVKKVVEQPIRQEVKRQEPVYNTSIQVLNALSVDEQYYEQPRYIPPVQQQQPRRVQQTPQMSYYVDEETGMVTRFNKNLSNDSLHAAMLL